MTKKTCNSCNFFKKKLAICEYYESNTYADTPACSKYQGEVEDEEDNNSDVEQSLKETVHEGDDKHDVKNSIETSSAVVAEDNDNNLPEKTETDNESVNEDSKEKTESTLSNKNANDSFADKEENDDENGNLNDEVVNNSRSKEKQTADVGSEPSARKSHVVEVATYTPERMFAHPFSFKGRIRRLEYGLSIIITFIASSLAQSLSVGLGWSVDEYEYNAPLAGFAYLVFIIPVIWFSLAAGAKRCHDIGYTGWTQLIPFFVFLLLFCGGSSTENRYGMPPKAS